jgi:hypothetical protein
LNTFSAKSDSNFPLLQVTSGEIISAKKEAVGYQYTAVIKGRDSSSLIELYEMDPRLAKLYSINVKQIGEDLYLVSYPSHEKFNFIADKLAEKNNPKAVFFRLKEVEGGIIVQERFDLLLEGALPYSKPSYLDFHIHDVHTHLAGIIKLQKIIGYNIFFRAQLIKLAENFIPDKSPRLTNMIEVEKMNVTNQIDVITANKIPANEERNEIVGIYKQLTRRLSFERERNFMQNLAVNSFLNRFFAQATFIPERQLKSLLSWT